MQSSPIRTSDKHLQESQLACKSCRKYYESSTILSFRMCTWKNRKFLKERAMATGKMSSTLNSSRLGKDQDEANKTAKLGSETAASPKKADLASNFDSTIQQSPKKSFKIKGQNTANVSLSPKSKQKVAPFKHPMDLNTLGSRTKGKHQLNKQSFTPGRTPVGAQSVPA